MDAIDVDGQVVGMCTSNSQIGCSLCQSRIVIKLGQVKEVVGYLINTDGEWELSGLYCESCEAHGSQIPDPTEGVAEVTALLKIRHDMKKGTVIERVDVMERSDD